MKIVIKVGTSTLFNGGLREPVVDELVKTIAELRDSGHYVVLVSSGAISVGCHRLGIPERPKKLPHKQAAAAVGQSLLMAIYEEKFKKHGKPIGQVLLTKNCLDNDEKYQHTVNTFAALHELGIVPIVNENDTVAVDEIVVGDNDTLSAYVANIINADLLILLSDVDGFMINGVVIGEITCLADVWEHAGDGRCGGMITKLRAAEIANAKTIIMMGSNPKQIHDVMGGKQIGTLINLG
ncbi:MAG: glutamate 5-kinase [Firmicutes bacterium]|nr:glutamate 5-kinase [Bacillota bacterium]